MNEKINIIKEDGSNISADIVCALENTTNNKKYVYYTLNEIVGAGPNSTVKIYVSKIKQDNPALDTPISEEDWGVLKGYMGDSLKGNANPEISYIPLNELNSPTSVSERAIAMPTSYDYINKQRGLYAQSIAAAQANVEPTSQASTEPTTPAPTEEPTPATSEPVQMESHTQDAMPTVETPVPETPVEQPAPIAPVTPEAVEAIKEENQASITQASEMQPESISPAQPTVNVEEPADSSEDSSNEALKLKPIDLSEIENKYAEMISAINALKEKELEAAKRYNATLELNSMHIDQHTNYVQNDIKENIQAEAVQTNPVQPVTTTQQATDQNMATPQPVEPSPVTPVVPEPIPASSVQDLETNWFDMPANN